MRTLSYSQALAEAQKQEMLRDPRVILMGLVLQDPYGSAFGATKGISSELGTDRVLDLPISEAGYVGAAVGAAVTGMRPIVELQFSDWITIASDQLVNQAANMRYTFGGKAKVPMVLRAPVGGYLSAASQHSHMFESWFSFIPGLKVVLPSTPYDAKGLLISAIRDDNPVLFFEHKKLYETKGEVPEEPYTLPIGTADIKREGNDLTIVTYSFMVRKSLEAAEQLAQEGVEAEVLDLRTVQPLDKAAILKSVEKTGRLLIVQETYDPCSVASYVAALVADEGFYLLDAPIRRVTAKFAPIPFAPNLEAEVLPKTSDILEAARALVRGADAR